jgi:hypothetical protein
MRGGLAWLGFALAAGCAMTGCGRTTSAATSTASVATSTSTSTSAATTRVSAGLPSIPCAEAFERIVMHGDARTDGDWVEYFPRRGAARGATVVVGANASLTSGTHRCMLTFLQPGSTGVYLTATFAPRAAELDGTPGVPLLTRYRGRPRRTNVQIGADGQLYAHRWLGHG